MIFVPGGEPPHLELPSRKGRDVVLSSRFFMSLLARDSSSTLACNSVLTVGVPR